MGLLKWFCKRFICNSSCSYNNEIFCKESLNTRLDCYDLKFKDIKKIMKILNKRDLKDITNVSLQI